MDPSLSDLLLEEHSKRNSIRIAGLVLQGRLEIDELITTLSSPKVILAQRAASATNEYFSGNQERIVTHLPDLLTALTANRHPSVQRTVMRLLQFVEIPTAYEGKILELAYGLFLDSQKAIAIRVFSLQVIANICKTYPELKHELLTAIELIEAPTAALKARIRHIRRSLM